MLKSKLFDLDCTITSLLVACSKTMIEDKYTKKGTYIDLNIFLQKKKI